MASPDKRTTVIAKAAMVKLGDGIDIFTADDVLTAAGIDQTKLTQIRDALMEKVGDLAEPFETNV